MLYINNTQANLEIFNQVLNISDANGKFIRNIKISTDKIGFNVAGDIFKLLEILDVDLIRQFMTTVIIEDHKHNDYVDDCTDYLSSKIDFFLKSYNMQLAELAELIGVIYTELKRFVDKKEDNHVKRYDVLTKLALYFGCTGSELCNVNYILKRPI